MKCEMLLFINRQNRGGVGLLNAAAVTAYVMIRMVQNVILVFMRWYQILSTISEYKYKKIASTIFME